MINEQIKSLPVKLAADLKREIKGKEGMDSISGKGDRTGLGYGKEGRKGNDRYDEGYWRGRDGELI